MSLTRSLSDSELNEICSRPTISEQQRIKRYSGSQLTKTTNATEQFSYGSDSKCFIGDNQTFAPATSSSGENEESYERNDSQVLKTLQKNNMSDKQQQHQEDNQDKNCSIGESKYPRTPTLRNLVEVGDPGEHRQNSAIFKVPASLNECLHEPQNKEHHEKSLDNSVLYPILEDSDNKESFLVQSEDFIGEPRCVALKKYATDDDMDDVLEINFDEFDEDEDFIGDQTPKPKNTTKPAHKKNVDDMFMDDDDVEDSKKSDSTNVTKTKNNWDKPVTEKEEGELTPDLYSTAQSDGGDSKSTRTKKQDTSDTIKEKKPDRKESNQDFFLKINRCFRQLEREFCNMHVPRGSRRMIGQLQNTLCNVDRMKRRLAFLIDSAKNVSSERTKNVSSERTKNVSGERTKSSRDERRSASRRRSFDDGKPKSSGGRPEKSTSELLRDTIRSQREAEARMNRHIRRTAASIAYSGTKEEKQRIQSLFKRQMNLITQHVIQKKVPGKSQHSKTGDSRPKKEEETAKEKTKAPEPKTLEEMEAFLAALKSQKLQKEEILAQEKQKGLLKFTTKKGQSVREKRPQPVLLVGADPPQVDVIEETDWEKQMEVLKALSDKRKEILKNKKDYEEIRQLQEQLRILTKIDKESSILQSNSVSDKIEVNKEKNAITTNAKVSPTKEFKENPPKKTDLKKAEEITLKGEISHSISVGKDPKEMQCIEPTFQLKSIHDETQEMIPENSKKIRKRKAKDVEKEDENCSSEASKSDKELKGPISKKRKRIESGGELSSHKKHLKSGRKFSKSRHHRSDSGEVSIIDGRFDEKLPEELMSKKLLIVADKNTALLNERFCLKVVGNQIYLKKVGRRRTKRARKDRREQKKSNHSEKIDDGTSHPLEEMEDFLQQLRSKKKNVPSGEEDYVRKSNQPTREMKFMARIQAKRKAKLMACGSTTEITQKEAKFLKDFESQGKDPSDSPETEKRKQKLMQKIKEETDAIVLQQKLADDDPLSDVKNFLSMIKEAESSNDEKSKQICVSFSMKKSEVKQLENIASGATSSLTEESQKFLNSVRAKMRAKKAPVADFPDQKG